MGEVRATKQELLMVFFFWEMSHLAQRVHRLKKGEKPLTRGPLFGILRSLYSGLRYGAQLVGSSVLVDRQRRD